jgi:uncharacterized protein YbjT (DUF2867 family)
MKPASRVVLVTGATGYIGGRRVPRLLEAGCRVRCPARDPARLQGRPWLGQVEVVAGDCLRAETLPAAMQGVEVAFYLVHSMGGGYDFEQRDVLAARNFASAAKQAGAQRVFYLSGLGDPDTALSEHLRSRQETGAVLREAGVPVNTPAPKSRLTVKRPLLTTTALVASEEPTGLPLVAAS